MIHVWSKEIKSFYYTAIGYVFTGIFMLLSTVFFFAGNMASYSSDCMALLRSMSYLLMLLCPFLTMRLIAGERQQKTEQFLHSFPVPFTDIILGKYAAACTVLMITIMCSFIFPLIIALYGHLYMAETLTGYLGFALLGFVFISVDLMISAFCSSPLTACIAGLGINLLLWLTDVIAIASSGTLISEILSFFSPNQRFTPFACGQLSLANIVYSACFTAAMLLITIQIMSRKHAS